MKIDRRVYSCFLPLVIRVASDDNTTIYTFASSGTDQQIKLWRLYSLRDYKEPKGTSRLLPDGVIVSMERLSPLNSEQNVCKLMNAVHLRSSYLILRNMQIIPGASLWKCNSVRKCNYEHGMYYVNPSAWQLGDMHQVS